MWEGRITNGHKETFGGVMFTILIVVPMLKCIKLYTLNRHSFLYVDYSAIKL